LGKDYVITKSIELPFLKLVSQLLRGFVLSVFLFCCHSVMLALLIYFVSWSALNLNISLYFGTLRSSLEVVLCVRLEICIYCVLLLCVRLEICIHVYCVLLLCVRLQIYVLCVRLQTDVLYVHLQTYVLCVRLQTYVLCVRLQRHIKVSHTQTLSYDQLTSCWGHWHNSENLLMSINDNFKGSIHGQTMMCLKVLFSLRTLF
jgi:hypothetical protein